MNENYEKWNFKTVRIALGFFILVIYIIYALYNEHEQKAFAEKMKVYEPAPPPQVPDSVSRDNLEPMPPRDSIFLQNPVNIKYHADVNFPFIFGVKDIRPGMPEASLRELIRPKDAIHVKKAITPGDSFTLYQYISFEPFDDDNMMVAHKYFCRNSVLTTIETIFWSEKKRFEQKHYDIFLGKNGLQFLTECQSFKQAYSISCPGGPLYCRKDADGENGSRALTYFIKLGQKNF